MRFRFARCTCPIINGATALFAAFDGEVIAGGAGSMKGGDGAAHARGQKALYGLLAPLVVGVLDFWLIGLVLAHAWQWRIGPFQR